jgi:hypothetical protein
MAVLEDLTSYETVLAVLGADRSELPEEVFIARNIWDELGPDITSWMPIGDTVDEILVDADDPNDETHAADKLIKLKAYARYYCAWLLLLSGDLMFVERVSDGQNEGQRSKRQDYEAMIDRLAGRMEKFKTALLQIYNPAITYSSPVLFSSASPTYDPVTNTNT